MCIFDADGGEPSNFSGGALCFQLLNQEVLVVKINLRAQHLLSIILKELRCDLLLCAHLGCDILKKLCWERNGLCLLLMQQGFYNRLCIYLNSLEFKKGQG